MGEAYSLMLVCEAAPLTEPDPLMREVRPVAGTNAGKSPTMAANECFFHSSLQDIGQKLKEGNDTLVKR